MIFVTGATGFTGHVVIQELQKRKISFCCLIRDEKKARQFESQGVMVILGDVHNEGVYDTAFKKCNGLINIVSFNQEHVPLVIKKAKVHNIQRVLFISTTAIFTHLNAKSKVMRKGYEKKIRESNLDWTILRPTMIYGQAGDRNMERLIKIINRFPIHPILGNGRSLMQPIHVQDLANAIIDAYLNEGTIHKSINLSGKSPLDYRETVKTVSKLLNKSVYIFPLPVALSFMIAEICGKIPGLPNLKGEQVLRLNEDKNIDHLEAQKLFGFNPMSFEQGIKIEIDNLRESHKII